MFSSLYRRGGAPPRWLLTLLALLGVLGSASAASTTKSVTKPRSSISQTVFAQQTTVTQGCTISASPSPGLTDNPVSFTVSFSLATNGEYLVDFGDGELSPAIYTGNNRSVTLTHAYAITGPYLVLVKADPSRIMTMVPPPLCKTSFYVEAPKPTIDVNPQQVNVGELVTATFGNLQASSYGVDWGDGTADKVTGPTMTHKYLKDGGFVISLVQDGQPLAFSKVMVLAPKPTMSTDPQQINAGEVVTAKLGNLPTNLSGFAIDWGDGTTNPVTGPTMTHKYLKDGGFPIMLTQDGKPIVTSKVMVLAPKPTMMTNPAQVNVGEVVTATLGNLGTNLANYSVDWGDQTSDTVTGTTMTHKYAAPGGFPILLKQDGALVVATSKVSVVAPAATFTLSPNPALVGEQVSATPGGIVPSLGYQIDWGDNSTSPVTSNTPVTHKYAAPGTFVVTLSAPNSPSIKPFTVTLTVKLPTATLDAIPNPALVGEQITATPGGIVQGVAYTLDWGDGATSPVTGNTPVKHAYSTPGTFVVSLSAPNLAPVTVSVRVNPPAATLTVNPTQALVGEQVSATPGGLLSGTAYEIDWGDGKTSPATGTTPVKHAYAAAGVFVVTLSAPNNQFGIKPVTATVNVKLPNAALTVNPTTALVGEQVTATPGSIVPNVAYTLDWGDGQTSPVASNAPIKHAYTAPGVYVVKLTADGIAPVTATVTVKLPNAALTVNPTTALVNEQVTATPGSIVPNVAYTLDWGDGQTSPVTSNAPIKHAYAAPGVYVAKLTADGIAPVTATVTIKLPNAALTVNPTTALVNEQVTATPGSIVQGVAYTLDWGDGQTSPVTSNAPIKHAYTAPGVYVVKLTADGIAPVTASVTVKLPNAGLTVTPNPVMVGEIVTATPERIVQGVAYTLDWGDGITAPVTTANPLRHGYSVPGVYVVKLTADGIPPVTVSVTVKAPNATLNVAPNPALVGEQVTATPGSIVSGLSYTLDWGDGQTSPVTSNAPIKHTYTAPGVYVVKLTADGIAPATVSVTVKLPAATLAVSPTAANVGEQITATPGGIVQGVAYTLDWGDGQTSPVTNNTPLKHTYTAPGVYVVKLSADGLAPATATVTIKVPVPTLDVQPNPALVNEQVTATPGNLVPNVAYTLDWGDGTTAPLSAIRSQAAAPLKHTYSAPGTYVVKLSAEGTAPATVSVVVKLPKPTLDVQPNPARTSETVVATPGTLIKGIAYTLDWGDGTTAPITGPLKHTYAAPGTYVLQLTSEGQPPITVTLKVNASLDVQALRLHFVKPEDRPVMKVFQNSLLTAALDLEYAGQGHVLGEVLLDGNSLARVDLNARVGATKVTFNIPNLPTSEIGTHTLEYRPDPVDGAAPQQSTPPSLIYTVVAAPTELEIAGFVFKITSLTNPDPNNFAGTGTHTLIVGGVEAFKDQKVTFQNLKVQSVSEERVKVLDGGFSLNLSDFKTTPLPAGIDGFYLAPNRVSFVPTGATFSGTVALATTCEPPEPASQSLLQAITFNNSLALLKSQPVAPGASNSLNPQPIPPKVMIMPMLPAGQKLASAQSLGSSSDFRFAKLQGGATINANLIQIKASVLAELTKYCRPDPKYSYSLNATLKPDSGDLYGTAPATLNSVKVPTTPFAMTGSSLMTLDLSAAQSAASLGDILSAYDKAPDATKPQGGEAWMGVVFDQAQAALDNAKTAPLSASLRHGFTFSSELAAGSFTDRGWTFNMDKLGLVVVENAAQSSDGKATTRLPMLAADVAVNISMKGAKLQYTLTDSVEHNFGKSSLKLGAGVWVESGERLDLNVTGAAWNMKQLSTLGLPKPPSPPPAFDFSFDKGALSLSMKASSSLKFIGNVPAQSGGQAQSSAMSSSISFNADKISTALLSVTVSQDAGSSGAGNAGGGTGTSVASSPVNMSLAVRFSDMAKNFVPPSDASYEDGVVTLNTLTMTADGNVGFTRRGVTLTTNTSPFTAEFTADGLSRKTLSVPDFKMLGQTFNVTDIVLGRQGGNYVLGFNGLQNLNPDPNAKLPGIGVTLRYRVAGGKDRELALHTDGFTSESDPNNARFRTEPSDTVLNLTTMGYVPVSDVRARLGANEKLKAGLKQVEGGFELTLNAGLDTGKGNSTIKVVAEAVFGLVVPDPYFYVKASVDSKAPIFSVLGTLNLYGFTGGIAYNMKWPDNATVAMYANPPTRVKTGVIQIIGGVTAAVNEGDKLHFKAIFKIDTKRGFELTADGWILTKMSEGVFGKEAPQARILISVTGEGFDMRGCLGKAKVDQLPCNDLRNLNIADVAEITAWVHVRVSSDKYVKIGTYNNPAEANFTVSPLRGVQAHAYLIFGEAKEAGDRKDDKTGTGFFVGYNFSAGYSIAGSLGKFGFDLDLPWPLPDLHFSCYPWARAAFDYYTSFDAELEFSPLKFDAYMEFRFGLDVRAGCADRDRPFANQQEILEWNGKSIGFHLDAELKGHLRAFRPIGFDGSAKLHVDLDFTSFTVEGKVSF